MQARQAVEAGLQQASEAAQRVGEREIELEQAEAQLAGRLAAAAALEARLRHQQVGLCCGCAAFRLNFGVEEEKVYWISPPKNPLAKLAQQELPYPQVHWLVDGCAAGAWAHNLQGMSSRDVSSSKWLLRKNRPPKNDTRPATGHDARDARCLWWCIVCLRRGCLPAQLAA